MNKNTGRAYTNTSLRSGRKAGMGIVYDDYSEESGFRGYGCAEWSPVRFPSDGTKPEELNGPVIIVQKGKVEHG